MKQIFCYNKCKNELHGKYALPTIFQKGEKKKKTIEILHAYHNLLFSLSLTFV